jgi:hypothetical protein
VAAECFENSRGDVVLGSDQLDAVHLALNLAREGLGDIGIVRLECRVCGHGYRIEERDRGNNPGRSKDSKELCRSKKKSIDSVVSDEYRSAIFLFMR